MWEFWVVVTRFCHRKSSTTRSTQPLSLFYLEIVALRKAQMKQKEQIQWPQWLSFIRFDLRHFSASDFGFFVERRNLASDRSDDGRTKTTFDIEFHSGSSIITSIDCVMQFAFFALARRQSRRLPMRAIKRIMCTERKKNEFDRLETAEKRRKRTIDRKETRIVDWQFTNRMPFVHRSQHNQPTFDTTFANVILFLLTILGLRRWTADFAERRTRRRRFAQHPESAIAIRSLWSRSIAR